MALNFEWDEVKANESGKGTIGQGDVADILNLPSACKRHRKG